MDNSNVFNSETFVVTWPGCDFEATLSIRTYKDFHDARKYATRWSERREVTVERVRTIIEVKKIFRKDWFLPLTYIDENSDEKIPLSGNSQ